MLNLIAFIAALLLEEQRIGQGHGPQADFFHKGGR
jgi:hypothetical protein